MRLWAEERNGGCDPGSGGNTIRGRIRHKVFQDCSGVENNNVEVRRFSILGWTAHKKGGFIMRRKFIAAVTSGVLALTVMAALPTHAEAVSIWLDLTPGTESVETFQYKDYADRYSDAYELYGYDAEALFNHYETVGKAENRVGRFKKTPEEDDRHPYVWDADEPLDPLPPLDFHAQPDWFDARTLPENLSNVRIIKEYEQLEAFIEKDEWIGDPVLVRKEELLTEMSSRVRNYDGRRGGADYLRAISQDIDVLLDFMG